MTMRPTDIRFAGAVPLDPRPATPPPGSAPAGGSTAVLDVTEASFGTDVLERSRTVPVVLDFWASWCAPCRQLSPILERLAAGSNGAWVLAKIDVDANPQLAQAAGVQGIPAVKAVVDGQLVAEFTGALPEAQVRAWVEELVTVAAEIRGAGGLPVEGDEAAPAAAVDPALEAGDAAVRRGDLDAAAAAYRELLDRSPGLTDAVVALARVELLRRTKGADVAAARRVAAEAPNDVPAQALAADFEFLAGAVEDGMNRLVDCVRRSSGDDRERARTHLLGLFDVLDPADPRLVAGRRALANALF